MRPDAQPAHYERLSPQDASFLAFESPTVFMHVGAVAVFEDSSFVLPSGEIDLARFRRYVESRLSLVPRTRQRLAKNPLTRQPVWIDDERFDITRHVREIPLATPGDDAALKCAASQVFSSSLDRSAPLWELHVVQGLATTGQFAVVAKAHHAMLDGVAGIDFTRILLSADGADDITTGSPFNARPAPTASKLARDALMRYLSAPAALARGLLAFARSRGTRNSFLHHAVALVTFMANGLRGTPCGPLTSTSNTERIVDWFTCDRADERAIRARLGGTRDDVALTVASGAVRQLLLRTGAEMTNRVRAMAPVNLRSRREANDLGNRVSMLIVELPQNEPSAALRLEETSKRMANLIEARHHLGVEALAKIDSWTGTIAQSFSMWLSRRVRAYNLVVTNIPGPPVALYALRSKLVAFYPIAPVFPDQHFNVAVVTYLGNVYWGVNYGGHDEEEPRRFVADLEASFGELRQAAAHAIPRVKLVARGSGGMDDAVGRKAGA